ncbi:putative PHD finger protein, partial [Naja naja]
GEVDGMKNKYQIVDASKSTNNSSTGTLGMFLIIIFCSSGTHATSTRNTITKLCHIIVKVDLLPILEN